MFKNRSVQVTLAKNDAKTPNEHTKMDRDAVVYWNAVIIANATQLGQGLIVLYAAKKAIDTASQIAVIKAAR